MNVLILRLRTAAILEIGTEGRDNSYQHEVIIIAIIDKAIASYRKVDITLSATWVSDLAVKSPNHPGGLCSLNITCSIQRDVSKSGKEGGWGSIHCTACSVHRQAQVRDKTKWDRIMLDFVKYQCKSIMQIILAWISLTINCWENKPTIKWERAKKDCKTTVLQFFFSIATFRYLCLWGCNRSHPHTLAMRMCSTIQ